MMSNNIPNILTLSRLLAIPLIIASFYIEDRKLANITGGFLFLFASITDFLDGFLARKYNLETKFGVIFDPISDKVLVACTMLMLIKFNKAEALPCILIISREFIISGIREYLVKEGITIPVSFLGKLKTFTQMVALFALIIGNVGFGMEGIDRIGNILLWISAILSVYSAISYLRSYAKYIIG